MTFLLSAINMALFCVLLLLDHSKNLDFWVVALGWCGFLLNIVVAILAQRIPGRPKAVQRGQGGPKGSEIE